jgi:transcriptional regulator with XRE-family HTH domain
MESIGQKLKELRTAAKLTLKQVAQQVDCTAAYLSQIENDKASPSIATLKKIAQVFDVRIVDFFLDEAHEDPVVTKPEQFSKVSMGRWQADIRQMISSVSQKRMQPFYTVIAPGGGSGGEYTHEGEEFGVVLEGVLTLRVGSDAYRVKKGESFYFSSLRPHDWSNQGAKKCVVIWVVSPPSW